MPAIAVFWLRRKARASPLIPPGPRLTHGSTACSCCAPTPRCRHLQVVLRYRNLLAVEQSFLAAKSLLATRPIFHRTDAAIRGHIFCTFRALVLRKELFDRLAARRQPPPEWQHIIDDLADLSTVEVEQDGRRALLRTVPRDSVDPICRALGLILPPVFQEMPPAAAASCCRGIG